MALDNAGLGRCIFEHLPTYYQGFVEVPWVKHAALSVCRGWLSSLRFSAGCCVITTGNRQWPLCESIWSRLSRSLKANPKLRIYIYHMYIYIQTCGFYFEKTKNTSCKTVKKWKPSSDSKFPKSSDRWIWDPVGSLCCRTPMWFCDRHPELYVVLLHGGTTIDLVIFGQFVRVQFLPTKHCLQILIETSD